jgi:hypothetical protein
LAQQSKALMARDAGAVPCILLKLTVPERMLLTVRINRAKGSHIALKMSQLVKALVEEHGMAIADVAKEIGGTVAEVELLLMDNVFVQKDTQNHKYSRAWKPKMAVSDATPIEA